MTTAHQRKLLGAGAAACWITAGIWTAANVRYSVLDRYETTFLLLVGGGVSVTVLWFLAGHLPLGTGPQDNRDMKELTRRVADIQANQEQQQAARDRIADAFADAKVSLTKAIESAGTPKPARRATIWESPRPATIDDACAAASGEERAQRIDLPQYGYTGIVKPGMPPDAAWDTIRHSLCPLKGDDRWPASRSSGKHPTVSSRNGGSRTTAP